MKRKSSHLITSISLGIAFALSPLLYAQKEPRPDPKPTQLSVTPLDERTAVVSGRFPFEKRGGKVEVNLGEKSVVLEDNGENGDIEPEDGIFSTKTEFDPELFIEGNRAFAEVNQKGKQPIFEPGGRQLVGQQSTFIEGEHVFIEQDLGGREPRQFQLPLDPGVIKPELPIELPVPGPALGLPFKPIPLWNAEAEESLVITRLDVVNDPDRTWYCDSEGASPNGNPHGDWTFVSLMDKINNGSVPSTSDFIKDFFKHWTTGQSINDHTVAAREHVYEEVIKQWEIRSGGPGAALDPAESPFRLLGIVLRIDLRSQSGSVYGGGSAGEGRFVFALHDGDCNPMRQTVILEYKVPIQQCDAIREWAQAWLNLNGSTTYNQDLQALTDTFAAAGASPGSPNDSAIAQIRTNEFLARSDHAELREFVLPDSGGYFTQTTTKLEPSLPYNNSPALADFINTNWQDLVQLKHGMPEDFAGHNDFLAGAAPPAVLWNAPHAQLNIPSTPQPPLKPGSFNEAEAQFGLAFFSCSGCHQVETGTKFAHLHFNTLPGEEARLSEFFTGIEIPDPRYPSIRRQFNDFARREQDLIDAATMQCPQIGDFPIGNILVHRLTTPPDLQGVH